MKNRLNNYFIICLVECISVTACNRRQTESAHEDAVKIPVDANTSSRVATVPANARASDPTSKETDLTRTASDQTAAPSGVTVATKQSLHAQEILKQIRDTDSRLREVREIAAAAKYAAIQKDENCRKVAALIGDKEKEIQVALLANPEHQKYETAKKKSTAALDAASKHLALVEAGRDSTNSLPYADIARLCPLCAGAAEHFTSDERTTHLDVTQYVVEQAMAEAGAAAREQQVVDAKSRASDPVIKQLLAEIKDAQALLDQYFSQLPDTMSILKEEQALLQQKEDSRKQWMDFVAAKQGLHKTNTAPQAGQKAAGT